MVYTGFDRTGLVRAIHRVRLTANALLWVAFALAIPTAESSDLSTPGPGAASAADPASRDRKYMDLDLATLRSIKDEDLEKALMDIVFTRLKANPERASEVIGSLSPEFRVFYISWLVEAEVGNGGFHQFFWNASAQIAPAMPDAIEAIGDAEAADIAWRALSTLIAEKEKFFKFRQVGTLEAYSESAKGSRLNAFDAPFMERARGFSALRVRYVRQHERAFVMH
jgi:hypothetical protein